MPSGAGREVLLRINLIGKFTKKIKKEIMNKEIIKQKIQQKEQGLNGTTKLVTPIDGVPANQQANWMIDLLSQVYSQHGIAKNPSAVVESIASGQCRCWFVLEEGKPVAMAALIKQADGSVEIGRAVALNPGLGLGSIAIMRACIDHMDENSNPIVAEVRVADNFAGVPSGMATQNISFNQIGLTPHALAPMFSHGEPVRQEMFALASSQPKQNTEQAFIPDNKSAKKIIRPALVLSNNLFDNQIKAKSKNEQGLNNEGFELVQTEPFALAVPEIKGSSLEKVTTEGLEKSRFILLPIEMTSDNAGLILKCLSDNWLPCGVDRNPGPTGHPVLLLGRLRSQVLLAPTRFLDGAFSKPTHQALREIDRSFRKKGRK